jgi:hypothetical protein
VDRRLRTRLTYGAAAAVALFLVLWIVSTRIGSAQCGNADAVECTPLGWVMLYGWGVMAVGTAAFVLLVAALWLIAGVRHLVQRP